jgi:hypothetical protein
LPKVIFFLNAQDGGWRLLVPLAGGGIMVAPRFVSQIGTFVPVVATVFERDVSHTRRKAHDRRKIAEAE